MQTLLLLDNSVFFSLKGLKLTNKTLTFGERNNVLGQKYMNISKDRQDKNQI